VGRRLLMTLPTLFGVVVVAFLLLNVAPGDPVAAMVGERADAATIARLRADLHLDDPLPARFGSYLWAVLHGDLGRSYITQRAIGLSEATVIRRHGFRNALIPVITVIGLDTGSYLTGSILTETIFGWPGLGRYVLSAIEKRDLPAIQGSILFMSLVFLLVNL